MASKNHFDRLTDPVLLEILHHLPPKDLLNVSSLSGRFYKVASDDLLWESFSDPFPVPRGIQKTKYSAIHPHKARAMRAMKIDYNFRCSMKPFKKIVRKNVEHLPSFICMDEAVIVVEQYFSSTTFCAVMCSLDGKLSHRLTECRLGDCWSLRGQLTTVNDDRVLVTLCEAHSIRVFSVASGVCLRTIDIKPSGLRLLDRFAKLVVHAQTAVYVSGSHVAVWDIGNGKLMHKLGGDEGKTFTCVTLDATHIAAASSSRQKLGRQRNELKVWNRESGQLEHSIDIGKTVSLIQLCKQWVIYSQHGSNSCGGRIWNTVTGELSQPFDMGLNSDIFMHKDQVVGFAKDGRVSLYNMEGHQLSSIEVGQASAPALMGVFDNGFAVTNREDGTAVKLIDLNAVGERGKRVTKSSFITLHSTVLAVFTTPVVAANFMLELTDFDAPLPR